MPTQLRKVNFFGLVIYLLSSLLFFQSCSDEPDNKLAIFKSLDAGMEQAELRINRHSDLVYHKLEESLRDSLTSRKARKWVPKTERIHGLAEQLTNYIDSLKTELKKEAGFVKDEKNSFREDDINAVAFLFYTKGQSSELRKRVDDYKDNLLATDVTIDSTFRSTMSLDVTETFFNEVPAVAALAELSRLKCATRDIENRIVNFCRHKISYIDDIFDSYSAIIGQSSNIVQAGETVEISAGMGGFDTSCDPEIIIDGKIVALEHGVANYRFKASGKPGKYVVPVKIRYNGRWGRSEIEKKIVYTITEGNH